MFDMGKGKYYEVDCFVWQQIGTMSYASLVLYRYLVGWGAVIGHRASQGRFMTVHSLRAVKKGTGLSVMRITRAVKFLESHGSLVVREKIQSSVFDSLSAGSHFVGHLSHEPSGGQERYREYCRRELDLILSLAEESGRLDLDANVSLVF